MAPSELQFKCIHHFTYAHLVLSYLSKPPTMHARTHAGTQINSSRAGGE